MRRSARIWRCEWRVLFYINYNLGYIMPRVNKIIKYGLEKEVNPLLDEGYSSYKIAEVIKQTHPEEEELQNISHMSIERYIPTREKDKLMVLADQGVNVTEYLSKQLLMETHEIMSKIHNLCDEADKLYQEAKSDESSTYKDKVSILKELRENLQQQTRVLESRIQYGARQMKHNNQNQEKKYQTLNITLVQMADDLCPKCKKKILEKLRE